MQTMRLALSITVYYLDEDETISHMTRLSRMVLDGYRVKTFLDLSLSASMNGTIQEILKKQKNKKQSINAVHSEQ